MTLKEELEYIWKYKPIQHPSHICCWGYAIKGLLVSWAGKPFKMLKGTYRRF